jgi:putative heme degradation protein
MEQIRMSRALWDSGQTAVSGADSARGSEFPRLETLGHSRQLLGAAEGFRSKSLAPHCWAVPLSLDAFGERVRLLTELEIPCVFIVNNAPAGKIHSGAIRRVRTIDSGMELLGDDFRLCLAKQEIASLWLLYATSGAGSVVSVEVLRKPDGFPWLRMLGLETGDGAAVWRDVMGNPSLSVE